jgi:hypothetical protein
MQLYGSRIQTPVPIACRYLFLVERMQRTVSSDEAYCIPLHSSHVHILHLTTRCPLTLGSYSTPCCNERLQSPAAVYVGSSLYYYVTHTALTGRYPRFGTDYLSQLLRSSSQRISKLGLDSWNGTDRLFGNVGNYYQPTLRNIREKRRSEAFVIISILYGFTDISSMKTWIITSNTMERGDSV